MISPAILLILLSFPDWEFSYIVDIGGLFKTAIGPWLGVAFIIWLNLMFLAGFNIGERLIMAGRRDLLQITVKGLLSLIVAITVVVGHETLHLGGFEEYHAGTAPLIFSSGNFLLAAVVFTVMLSSAYFWAIRRRE
ncbi:MAG: hypothetical protein OEU51_07255 [Gammaproteobacteria bacterium]|nr:hypothetical protein [Gammaproteobacteria bacterium]